LVEVDFVDSITLSKAAGEEAGEAAADRGLDLLLRDPLLVGVKEVAVLDAAEATSRVPAFCLKIIQISRLFQSIQNGRQ
jgi:hypothetical protein